MQPDTFKYYTFVIRLWSEPTEQSTTEWRISVESSVDQGRQGFSDLRALLDEVEEALTALMSESEPPPADTSSQAPSGTGC